MESTKIKESSANQKRIAIQFYGYLRSYAECKDRFFKHLVEPIKSAGYEVDIFMHSWDYIEGRVTSWHHEKTALDSAEPPKTPPKEDLIALYDLKAIAITPQVESKDDEKFIAIRYECKYRYKSLANAYYSLHSVNKLRLEYEKQNGVKYDFVIVTRPDLLFVKDFSLGFLGDGSAWGRNHKSKLFGYYSVMESEQAGLDLFYMAHPSIINAIANLYPTLDYEKLNNADLYNPESVMQNFIVDNRIELLNLNLWSAPFVIKRTKEYMAFRIEEAQSDIVISRKSYDELKRLEHFSGFVRFYTRKKMAILRRNTRTIRYPIKRLFGFDNKQNGGK